MRKKIRKITRITLMWIGFPISFPIGIFIWFIFWMDEIVEFNDLKEAIAYFYLGVD